MRAKLAAIAMLTLASPASANDWAKYYTPISDPATFTKSTLPPMQMPSNGNSEADITGMWRQGYTAVGYSAFNSSNSRTSDAMKWAAKIGARYVMISTDLKSSSTAMLPLTTPTTTTSTTSGTVDVNGSGGFANGSYSGTTTNYGTSTTYIPMRINRFDKVAVYFAPTPNVGTGILGRALDQQEIAKFETERAIFVRAVRDGSPAYEANVLPRDVILSVNGQPADYLAWRAAMTSQDPMHVHLIRNGSARDLTIVISEAWRSS